ncbi:MAG: hypothetical protein WCI05_11835 [Myxococcales bacterium]
MNAANLRWGLEDYRALLGITPKTLLVNEQAYSRASVDHALAAGFTTMVLEWENSWRANPSWDRRWAYAPQLLHASNGASARTQLLWNQSIAFQKVQRFVHGELELDDLLNYVDAQRGPEERAFCIYGSDAEIFDYRPGRFRTEGVLEHQEWRRLTTLFAALRDREGLTFELPMIIASRRFPLLGDRYLEPQSAAEPVPTKKQGKYNVTRWAVTGRDDLLINTACQRIHDALLDVPLEDPRWGELCELWASDFRTHITDARWTAYRKRLASVLDSHHLAIALRDATRAGRDPLQSVQDALIERGRRWSADWFSGHLVFEAPGKPKVTDLERVEPTVTLTDDAVVVTGRIASSLGAIDKTITISRLDERIQLGFELHWPELPVGSLRLGHVLLKPRFGPARERGGRRRALLTRHRLERLARFRCNGRSLLQQRMDR